MALSLLDIATQKNFDCRDYSPETGAQDDILVTTEDDLVTISQKAQAAAERVLSGKSIAACLVPYQEAAEQLLEEQITGTAKLLWLSWKSGAALPPIDWGSTSSDQSGHKVSGITDGHGRSHSSKTTLDEKALALLYHLDDHTEVTEGSCNAFKQAYTPLLPLLEAAKLLISIKEGQSELSEQVSDRQAAQEKAACLRVCDAIERQKAYIQANVMREFSQIDHHVDILKSRVMATQKHHSASSHAIADRRDSTKKRVAFALEDVPSHGSEAMSAVQPPAELVPSKASMDWCQQVYAPPSHRTVDMRSMCQDEADDSIAGMNSVTAQGPVQTELEQMYARYQGHSSSMSGSPNQQSALAHGGSSQGRHLASDKERRTEAVAVHKVDHARKDHGPSSNAIFGNDATQQRLPQEPVIAETNEINKGPEASQEGYNEFPGASPIQALFSNPHGSPAIPQGAESGASIAQKAMIGEIASTEDESGESSSGFSQWLKRRARHDASDFDGKDVPSVPDAAFQARTTSRKKLRASDSSSEPDIPAPATTTTVIKRTFMGAQNADFEYPTSNRKAPFDPSILKLFGCPSPSLSVAETGTIKELPADLGQETRSTSPVRGEVAKDCAGDAVAPFFASSQTPMSFFGGSASAEVPK